MSSRNDKYSAGISFFILRDVEEHSDEVEKATSEFFKNQPIYAQTIEDYVMVFRRIMDIVPSTVDNFMSGSLFPYTEAEYELNSAIYFVTRGFYKQAINGLRSVLELGLLNVYWDVEDNAHIDIQNWLKSKEDTPFRKGIEKRLLENENIKVFDKEMDYFKQVEEIYKKLSNFSHTKGAGFSSRALSTSNFNTFNEKALKYWILSLQKVIRLVMAVHILKYPVAYQYTEIDEKFGLNGPVGGFLNPYQVEMVKKIFDEETNKLLQRISDADPNAKQIADWVNNHPDITEEELEQQAIDHDKSFIPNLVGGFPKWLEDQEKMSKMYEKSGSKETLEKHKKHIAIITEWAKKEGLTAA